MSDKPMIHLDPEDPRVVAFLAEEWRSDNIESVLAAIREGMPKPIRETGWYVLPRGQAVHWDADVAAWALTLGDVHAAKTLEGDDAVDRIVQPAKVTDRELGAIFGEALTTERARRVRALFGGTL